MKHMKYLLLVAAAFGLLANPAVFADEHDAAAAGLDVSTAYIFRGATVSDDVGVFPSLEGVFNGVTAGVWAWFDTDDSEVEEIDIYFSYDLDLGGDAVDVSIGYTEYTYPNTTDATDREVSVVLELDGALSPSVSVHYGFEGALDEGLYVEANLSRDLDLGESLTVNAGVMLGAQLGDNVANDGLAFAKVSVSTSVGIANVSVSYIIETDDDVQLIDEDVYGSIGVGFPL
tara:strand:- start:221 stop:910 length:690 start_codon:yes stop_codon:yes gene_type:complete